MRKGVEWNGQGDPFVFWLCEMPLKLCQCLCSRNLMAVGSTYVALTLVLGVGKDIMGGDR